MINISINLSQIPENKKIKGKKGDYLNLTIQELKQPDNYGNTHTVYVSQSKEEREAKVARTYLGNGKEFKFNQQGSTGSQQGNYQTPNNGQDDGSGLPF